MVKIVRPQRISLPEVYESFSLKSKEFRDSHGAESCVMCGDVRESLLDTGNALGTEAVQTSQRLAHTQAPDANHAPRRRVGDFMAARRSSAHP